MAILKLLSEEVFDFSRGELTQVRGGGDGGGCGSGGGGRRWLRVRCKTNSAAAAGGVSRRLPAGRLSGSCTAACYPPHAGPRSQHAHAHPRPPSSKCPRRPGPQDKTRHLKQTLNTQFRMIHELCTFVLLNTRKESLVRATLTALHAYLSWVPVGCAARARGCTRWRTAC